MFDIFTPRKNSTIQILNEWNIFLNKMEKAANVWSLKKIKQSYFQKSNLVYDIITNDFVMIFTNFVQMIPFILMLSSNLQHLLSHSVTPPPLLIVGVQIFQTFYQGGSRFLLKIVDGGCVRWDSPYCRSCL